ncbi:MAG: hypothetical protein M3Z49_05235, partial [Bifidobacteriales bacterium]|nr:hypothetical protein [Bifidobacteriales bacterium]
MPHRAVAREKGLGLRGGQGGTHVLLDQRPLATTSLAAPYLQGGRHVDVAGALALMGGQHGCEILSDGSIRPAVCGA